MYGTLALSHRALDDLVDSAGRDTIDELRSLARPIEGLRVLNLSVTGFGTGTAELLSSSVPVSRRSSMPSSRPSAAPPRAE